MSSSGHVDVEHALVPVYGPYWPVSGERSRYPEVPARLPWFGQQSLHSGGGHPPHLHEVGLGVALVEVDSQAG